MRGRTHNYLTTNERRIQNVEEPPPRSQRNISRGWPIAKTSLSLLKSSVLLFHFLHDGCGLLTRHRVFLPEVEPQNILLLQRSRAHGAGPANGGFSVFPFDVARQHVWPAGGEGAVRALDAGPALLRVCQPVPYQRWFCGNSSTADLTLEVLQFFCNRTRMFTTPRHHHTHVHKHTHARARVRN